MEYKGSQIQNTSESKQASHSFTVPSTQKTKLRRDYLIILVFVFVLVMVVGFFLSHSINRKITARIEIYPTPTPGINLTGAAFSGWRTFVNADNGMSFDYPKNSEIGFLTKDSIDIHSSDKFSVDILLIESPENTDIPYDSEKIVLTNRDVITFNYYHYPKSTLSNLMVGKYKNNHISYQFNVNIIAKNAESVLPDIRKIISSFSIVPKNKLLDKDGLKTFSAVRMLNREQISFKYPSNYYVTYNGGAFTITDQANKDNYISIVADSGVYTDSYAKAITDRKRNSLNAKSKPFGQGVLFEDLVADCSPITNECNHYSEIVIPYGDFAGYITFTEAIKLKDLKIIVDSFKHFD